MAPIKLFMLQRDRRGKETTTTIRTEKRIAKLVYKKTKTLVTVTANRALSVREQRNVEQKRAIEKIMAGSTTTTTTSARLRDK